MELQQFPVGKKFYPLNENSKLESAWAEACLTKKYLECTKYLAQWSKCGNQYHTPQSISALVNTINILSDEEYPKVEIKAPLLFLCISEGWNITCNHVAAMYQTPERIRRISNMPYFEGMIVQWDNDRKGFILHNAPYEGELVPTKESAKVKRDIKDHINHVLGDVNMFTLLGDELYVPWNMRWMSSIEEAKSLHKIFLDTQKENADLEQVIQLAISSKAYTSEYNRDRGRDYGKSYILTKTNKKPKLPTSVRTKLIFQLGGLTLPDDYQQWFDG